jgi:hypothetical protein
MPISAVRAKAHTSTWEKRCSPSYWPHYLFHHAHATAAAAIIQAGELLCRNQQGGLIHDVANQGAINSNPDALEYVRLYFRPLTDFHLSTEGIKLRDDRYRMERHMSIPIAFAFGFEKTIIREGVGFSHRKLAHDGAQPSFTEEDFNRIEFSNVYHNGPLSGTRKAEVHDQRMAEVVAPDKLPLANTLEYILCRSVYDEITLRHIIGGHADSALLDKIRVATSANEIFFCWGIFIKELKFQDDCLSILIYTGLSYRRDKEIKFKISQFVDGELVRQAEFSRSISGKTLRVTSFERTPEATWTIELEDVLAFSGPLPYGQSQLVKP